MLWEFRGGRKYHLFERTFRQREFSNWALDNFSYFEWREMHLRTLEMKVRQTARGSHVWREMACSSVWLEFRVGELTVAQITNSLLSNSDLN